MSKWMYLALASTLGTAGLILAPANPPVELQPTSPGIAQSGHLNVSGTATVGLLKSQGTVFGQSEAPTGFAYGGFFTAASNQGRGFYGFASSPTGLTYGGFFQNASSQGRAVYGLATSTAADNYGGYFQAAGTSARGVLGIATAATGTTYGVYGRSMSPSGFGVYSNGNMGASGVISGNGSGLTSLSASNLVGTIFLSGSPPKTIIGAVNTNANARALEGLADNPSGLGQGVFGSTNGQGVGVFGESSNASGTGAGVQGVSLGSSGYGVVGHAMSPSGATFGVSGRSDSTNGQGVYGIATATSGLNFGGDFASNGTSGVGVRGSAFAATGITFGVQGKSYSPNGTGVHGVASSTTGANFGGRFTSNSFLGIGVEGWATATDGATAGVYGRSDSPVGTGVRGMANASSGICFGVFGGTVSTSGDGLRGRATATTGPAYGVNGGSESTQGIGVYGVALALTGTNYGVAGQAFSGSAYGVYAYGNTGASGTKSFRIDHPFNPENEYLLHYSAEGPEPLNVYCGTTQTDPSGYATVLLPDYFSEINRDPRIQLTVDDKSEDFVLVKVLGGVQNNQFRIRTNKGNVKVYWEVKGVRNDLWVRKYGAPVEVQKEGLEKSKYQHPELHGKPKEMAMTYRPGEGNTRTHAPVEPSAKSRLKR